MSLSPESTNEAYRRSLIQQLPRGVAWTGERDSVLWKLLLAFGTELGNLDARTKDILDEIDARTTEELLEEWEDLVGLPGACVSNPSTDIEDRRAALLTRLKEKGGHSIPFFVELALSLGFQVEIEEFCAFRAGKSGAGDPVYDEDGQFVWKVHASNNLTADQRELLECSIERVSPAYTLVLFEYDLDTYVREAVEVGLRAPACTLVFS